MKTMSFNMVQASLKRENKNGILNENRKNGRDFLMKFGHDKTFSSRHKEVECNLVTYDCAVKMIGLYIKHPGIINLLNKRWFKMRSPRLSIPPLIQSNKQFVTYLSS